MAEIEALGSAINNALYNTPYNGSLNIPGLSKDQRDAAAHAALAALSRPAPAAEVTREQVSVPLPTSLHWLGERHQAEASGHAMDMRGCVAYFDRQSDCLEFMRHVTRLTTPSPDAGRVPENALNRIKDKIDSVLNDHLCEMKPFFDDSIVGFNEAWDIVRKVFADAASPAHDEVKS